MIKMQRTMEDFEFNPFDLLTEEILFAILDCLNENPLDKKSFSIVCKSFYIVEARHRKTLKPLRSELLPTTLNRYPFVTHLDLSLCPRITDSSLTIISTACKATLQSIDLSRSKFFSHVGLSNLFLNCSSLVEIDLSNAAELTDSAAVAIAEVRNLKKLWLARCKLISDMGIGCIAVGCRKLRLICLKWCLSVSDLGVALIAIKCKEIRSLDLSYLPEKTLVGHSSLCGELEDLERENGMVFQGEEKSTQEFVLEILGLLFMWSKLSEEFEGVLFEDFVFKWEALCGD